MTGRGGIDIAPGTIVRVTRPGHVLHRKYAIADGVVAGMKLVAKDNVTILPALVTVRGAEGDFAGESFALPPLWVKAVAVPPLWAAKLRRQAYGLDKPLTPGNAL